MIDDIHGFDERWLIENGLFDIADPSHLYSEIVARRERGDDGIKPPVSKLEGRFSIPLRGITVLGAYSGTGKSTFASQWAVHAANCGRKVAVMSLEMPPDFTLELMAEQSACLPTPHLGYVERFSRWADGRIYLHSSTDVISPEKVYQFVEVAVTMLGCEMVVIDPLMQVGLSTDIDAEKEFITKLATLSRNLSCAIVCVHHLRKPPSNGGLGERSKPTKSDFLGSTHITGAAAAVCTLWCDPDKREARSNGEEVDDDYPDFLFTVHKQRFAPWHGSVGLYQHRARLLTNSRARQYRPINLKEDEECTETQSSTGLSVVSSLDGLPESRKPETTPEIDSIMNLTASHGFKS